MSSRHSLPRIRINSLDSYLPHDLSPSASLDIGDILGRAVFSSLLAEDFKFDDINDFLFFDEACPRKVPAFPDGHRPPLFTVNSHRVQLPFPLRPEALGLSDSCQDERHGSLLLTSPTTPRMKLMIVEQLYVQKWVDSLTFDIPPKHIPWTSDTPSLEKKWISEGSIFPVDLIKSSAKQHQRIQGRPGNSNADGSQGLRGDVSNSRDLRKWKVSSRADGRTRSHTLAPSIHAKSVDLDTKLSRGEMKNAATTFSQVPRRRVASTPHPLTSPPSVTPNGTTRAAPIAPLAARRGKTLSDLKLKGAVIEELEYPDIPTAFRGSSNVWPPQFDARLAAPFFTSHQDMLLNLQSKSAVLGSVPSIWVQEPKEENERWSDTETTYASIGAERTSPLGLSSFERTLQGSFDELAYVRRETTADTSIFLPCDTSTLAKHPYLVSESYPRSFTPMIRPPTHPSSGPPRVPLPPRPALVSPSTPPHVRGILKKAKSVRFEDAIFKEPQSYPSSIVPPHPQPVLKAFSPLRQTTIISPHRPCTPVPSKPSEPKGLAKVKAIEGIASGSETLAPEKKPPPRPRLTPRRVKSGGDLASSSLRSKDGNAPEPTLVIPFKPTPATSQVERPCQIVHVKDRSSPIASTLAQGKQRGLLLVTETDVRRGIEGTPKRRISTPLRNIFRFK